MFDSPLHDAARSQISPLYCMMQRGVKSMIVAEIFPLHDAAGSQTFLLHIAARCIMQRGVKSRCCTLQRGVKSYRRMMQRGVNLAAGSQV